jgi:hypothetical protein
MMPGVTLADQTEAPSRPTSASAKLEELLGPTADTLAHRAAVASVAERGHVSVEAIGSLDVPTETEDDQHVLIGLLVAAAAGVGAAAANAR